MPVEVEIKGLGANKVEVTPNNELLTTKLAFADALYTFMDVNNAVFNLYGPKTGERLRFAGIIAKADRFVGANGSLLTIYETDAIDSAVQQKILFKTELAKDQNIVSPVEFQAAEGAFVNAVMDDNDIHLTTYANFVPTPTEES